MKKLVNAKVIFFVIVFLLLIANVYIYLDLKSGNIKTENSINEINKRKEDITKNIEDKKKNIKLLQEKNKDNIEEYNVWKETKEKILKAL